MTDNIELDSMVRRCGYPLKRVSHDIWSQIARTGVLDLIIELHRLQRHVLVTTRDYLVIPEVRVLDGLIVVSDLQWLGGIARFLTTIEPGEQQMRVEVGCFLSNDLLSPESIRTALESVASASVWYAPLLISIAEGLPVPPPWPQGKDPSLGLDWTDRDSGGVE